MLLTQIIIFYSNFFSLAEYLNYNYIKKLYRLWYNFSSFFYHAGFFNNIYNNIFLYLFELSYYSINKFLDKGLFEFLGPYGFYKLIYIISKLNNSITYNIFLNFGIFIIFLFNILIIFFILNILIYFYSIFIFHLSFFIVIISLFIITNYNKNSKSSLYDIY